MKFKRLSEDSIQIIISAEDLEDMHMSKRDIFPFNANAQMLFLEILKRAAQEFDFHVQYDTRLVVEAYPLGPDSFMLNITKLDGKEAGTRGALKMDGMYQKLQQLLLEEPGVIYRFHDLEDVILAAKAVPQSVVNLTSKLYKDDKGAFLLQIILDKDQAFNEFASLLEYADPIPLTEAYLYEHAEPLVAEDALSHLRSL